MTALLASSPTLEGLERAINAFWFSSRYGINRETLQIERDGLPIAIPVRVIRKGSRYRFEKTD